MRFRAMLLLYWRSLMPLWIDEIATNRRRDVIEQEEKKWNKKLNIYVNLSAFLCYDNPYFLHFTVRCRCLDYDYVLCDPNECRKMKKNKNKYIKKWSKLNWMRQIFIFNVMKLIDFKRFRKLNISPQTMWYDIEICIKSIPFRDSFLLRVFFILFVSLHFSLSSEF